MTIKLPHIKLLFIVVFPLLFNACNPARKLNSGDYLLSKNYIIYKNPKIDKSDIESYIKQKPNRKIFGVFRFHLWLHNLINEDRVRRKRILYDKKIESKNEKRIAKGKKAKKNNHELLGERLLDISEAPVIVDSTLTKKSDNQIKLFLNNKGYFINSVSDSIYYKRRKKANIYYKIKTSAPYTLNKLDYKISDDLLKQFVFDDTSNTLISKGNNYDVDIIQKERDRVTSSLNNNGYYLFTKDYIYYEIDTTLGNRKVNITMGIKNYAQKLNDYSDSIVETPHQRFYINNVYVQPDFISKKENIDHKDTLMVDSYFFLHTKKLRYKTKVLLDAIFIRKGELYQLKNADDTYKRLSELKAFKSISITFTQGANGYLDCYILLSPILKQSFSVETEGTNSSGNIGVSGSFVFQNRNLFKGAEVFELRLKGGIEAQRAFTTTTTKANAPIQKFNTVEFGPVLNINVPRFLLPFRTKVSKNSNPKTVFTSALDYQKRPDYTRNITNFSLSYTWNETSKKHHTINPFVINYVKVDPSKSFNDLLNSSVSNIFIKNSFISHLSTSTRYSYVFNEQDLKRQKNFSYFKFNAESSGNILRGLYELTNSIHANTLAKDNQGRYTLLNIAYSQYLRIDADYRYYYSPNELSKIAFRILGGVGKPLANFQVLPFERSFYSGGANDIRAWQSRTLGPGSYADKTYSYDQFGDGQLEANIEYRFKLFKTLNGALFTDMGNTWLRQPDPTRPGGDFKLNRFYKEIAIGSGVGIRIDLSFFIIRLDVGIKIRDPQFDVNDRWVIQHLFDSNWRHDFSVENNNTQYTFFTYNLGIGYPF